MAYIPAPSSTSIINPSFEDGNTGWELSANPGATIAIVASQDALNGLYCVRHSGTGELADGSARGTEFYPVTPGQRITFSASINPIEGTPGTSGAAQLLWFDADGNYLSYSEGNNIRRKEGANWRQSVVSAVAPANAYRVKYGLVFNVSVATTTSTILGDAASWDYTYTNAGVITSPAIDSLFTPNESFALSVSTQGSVTQVIYRIFNSSDVEVQTITATSAPFTSYTSLPDVGDYTVRAEIYFNDFSYITTASRAIHIQTATVLTREYKASNAYTYLVGENISSIASAIPSTAIVVGTEVILDYTVDVISRTKNIGVDVTSTSSANPAAAFDIVSGGIVELALLSKSGGTYSRLGGTMTAPITIDRTDYTITEQGKSENKLYTYYTGTQQSVTVGGESSLFNLGTIDATSFINNAVAVRFYPTTGPKPSYADSGDACFRFKIDRWKVRVYFDAGSVEYYFASPDKTQVIKAELVSFNVDDGMFSTSDASGTLQLAPNLEIIDGTQPWIGDDWTIHSFYPVTDANKIGEVSSRSLDDGVGMSYNGLPGYWEVEDNRSRYMFITANFYGDPQLDSIYGANGADRGFSYNGEYFYKIHTQPDITKDMPRHVAFHHTHLALGYKEGRVDISVVGEPYNFSGVDGASSWAIGDSVVGLSPLSGTILGVFCQKSIVGISGTTVDNFATQTLSPKIGAIEYTITDMGYPVYANAYGIYTLSQTSQYGDYLGSPMSQAISPWLRPRLIRKAISPKEVVCAWPVRSKNQYRLAFADGYVLSMTMNYGEQTAPTFSKQKYFIQEVPTPETEYVNAVENGMAGAEISYWRFDNDLNTYVPTTSEASGVSMYYSTSSVVEQMNLGNNILTGGAIKFPEEFYGKQMRARMLAPTSDVGPVFIHIFRIAPDGSFIIDIDGRFYSMDIDAVGQDFYFVDADTGERVVIPEDSYMRISVERNSNVASTYEFIFEVEQTTDIGVVEVSYEAPSIVPAAISSELDESGEERIHIANKQQPPQEAPPAPCVQLRLNNDNTIIGRADFLNYIPDFISDQNFRLEFDPAEGTQVPYVWVNEAQAWNNNDGVIYRGPLSGRGTIYSDDMSQSVCVDWEITGAELVAPFNLTGVVL